MRLIFFLFFLLIFTVQTFGQKKYILHSPDGKLTVEIRVGDRIIYTLRHESDLLIDASSLSMRLSSGIVWGDKSSLMHRSSMQSVDETIVSHFSKSQTVSNKCNELTLLFKTNWGLKFRAYNDGMAYRFFNESNRSFEIEEENVLINFPADYNAYVPYIRNHSNGKKETFENQYQRSFESTYDYLSLSEMDPDRLMFVPVVIEAHNGKKIALTEADLESYPGLFLNKATGNALKGVFAPYPQKVEQGGHNKIQKLVKSREAFIAKVHGKRAFPWRVFQVSVNDKQLAVSDMSYRLAAPSRVEDVSWIKPGKVAWEWWNDWNIYGVDFQAGVNNETYKYYIDFASANGIEYIILDEGWSVKKKADLFQVVPEINLPDLIRYAESKHVGIILWAGYWAFDRDMERVCKHYADMGVKGFKVDFMNRDDQQMVDFIYRASETAAKYKLILNFHGMYKPAGLQRTFPNVLNFEGVFGLEQLKVRNIDMVRNDVIIPFVRMIAGPLDYTQGAMLNATKDNFRFVFSEPMSQGTRCRQLALYVIFESPLNMLCDSPTNYMKEKESLDFIAQIPTVWDESIPLSGKIGEHIVIARRKGDVWYVGGINNWNEFNMQVDLSFLPQGDYKMSLFKDGMNAHKKGVDYQKEIKVVNAGDVLDVRLAPGGGFALKLEKNK